MKVRLIGVLEHGAQKHLSLYTMTEEFEQGANHIIEALHRTLQTRSEVSDLPGTLFIQMDNCSRENKNIYFLGTPKALSVLMSLQRFRCRFFLWGIHILILIKLLVALLDDDDTMRQ